MRGKKCFGNTARIDDARHWVYRPIGTKGKGAERTRKEDEDAMYIAQEDFQYLETLIKGLDEGTRKAFHERLAREADGKAGTKDVGKIKVVGEDIRDRQGIDPGEWMTRTMIKKAYREAKEQAARGR